jgi:hypothetical protein
MPPLACPPWPPAPLQTKPWYDALEGMYHLLPEDDARVRLAGAGWALRLQRGAEQASEALDQEQGRLQEAMGAVQGAFNEGIEVLAQVCEGGEGRGRVRGKRRPKGCAGGALCLTAHSLTTLPSLPLRWPPFAHAGRDRRAGALRPVQGGRGRRRGPRARRAAARR